MWLQNTGHAQCGRPRAEQARCMPPTALRLPNFPRCSNYEAFASPSLCQQGDFELVATLSA